MTTINGSNEKVTLQDVEDFERRLQIKLPKEYKEFLLKFNGGYPEPSLFKISNNGESIVNIFYGLNVSDSCDELFEACDSLEGAIPDGFLSIGDDSGGNQICLGVNEEYYGNLYFWFHDIEDNDEVENMIFLSKDFNEFFDSLYDEE